MVSPAVIVSLSIALLCLASATTPFPQYSCASLGTNIAASYVSSNTYQINSNGCQSNYEVTMLGTLLWSQIGSTGTYPCTVTPTSTSSTSTTYTNTTITSFPCQTKLSNKNFQSGNALVLCSTSSDCILQDSTYASCQGILRSDGKGVCVPVASNTNAFQGYWDACGSSNSISSATKYTYWYYYISYWPYKQTDLTCTGFFDEIQILAALLILSKAEMMTAGVLALLALFN